MFQWLVNKFIPSHQETTNPIVREKYGTLCSLLSIVCNALMVAFKLIFGFMTNSAAIQADGFNNLSDMGSNLATLFGFKLAGKHPDANHPYGHGRYEYIAGLIISFLIFLVGFSSLKESLFKIVMPEKLHFARYRQHKAEGIGCRSSDQGPESYQSKAAKQLRACGQLHPQVCKESLSGAHPGHRKQWLEGLLCRAAPD